MARRIQKIAAFTALKDGDSCSQRRTCATEHIVCRIGIAVVPRTAMAALATPLFLDLHYLPAAVNLSGLAGPLGCGQFLFCRAKIDCAATSVPSQKVATSFNPGSMPISSVPGERSGNTSTHRFAYHRPRASWLKLPERSA